MYHKHIRQISKMPKLDSFLTFLKQTGRGISFVQSYGMICLRMVWENCCMVWYRISFYGMVYLCMVWYIFVGYGTSLYGMVYLCRVWYGKSYSDF